MLRIINKKIENNKKIVYALKIIYGININTSKKICKHIGINPNNLTINIEDYHKNRLIKYIKENIIIEHFLKEKEKIYINKLIQNKNIRGIRHFFGLPVRGQRTHSNAKTAKILRKK